MKRISISALLLSLAALLTGCCDKGPIRDACASKFLKKFYAEAVFNSGDPTAAVERDCTVRLQEELREACTDDDEGYAVRLFRSNSEGGEGNISKVTRVAGLGGDIFTVYFLDRSASGKCNLKLVREAGALKIDALFPVQPNVD